VLDRRSRRSCWPGNPSPRSPGSPAGGPSGSSPGASAPAWTWPAPTAAWSIPADGRRRGPVVGTQRRAGAADPHPPPLHKTLSRGGSFGQSTADPVVLYAWLVRNLERLIEELQFHGTLTAMLTVWVAYKTGRPARDGWGWRCRPTASTPCSTPRGPACDGPGSPASRPPTCRSSPTASAPGPTASSACSSPPGPTAPRPWPGQAPGQRADRPVRPPQRRDPAALPDLSGRRQLLRHLRRPGQDLLLGKISILCASASRWHGANCPRN
jgi:hypothetical protein